MKTASRIIIALLALAALPPLGSCLDAKGRENPAEPIYKGQVEIDPQPASLDAPFHIEGPYIDADGTGLSWVDEATPGTYTVTYGAVAGWITPAPETKKLPRQGSIRFAGTYVAQAAAPGER